MRLIDGTLTAEAMVRMWFMQAEAAEKKAGHATYGTKAGEDGRIFDFSGGSGLDIILKVLQRRRPTYKAKRANALTQSPAILRVKWDNPGAHFVVCIGDRDPNRIWYLDPWYGMVNNPKGIFPLYDTSTGTFGAGAGTGRFTHIINTKA